MDFYLIISDFCLDIKIVEEYFKTFYLGVSAWAVLSILKETAKRFKYSPKAFIADIHFIHA